MQANIPTYVIPPEALPAVLRELVRVLGDADALRLVGMHGGARVSVPSKVREDHPLRHLLGAESFARLVAEYAGETVELPKSDAYLRALRHAHVQKCRDEGMKIDEIAEATGYTRRHVINILGGHGVATDTHTMDLFEEPPATVTNHTIQANNPFGLGS